MPEDHDEQLDRIRAAHQEWSALTRAEKLLSVHDALIPRAVRMALDHLLELERRTGNSFDYAASAVGLQDLIRDFHSLTQLARSLHDSPYFFDLVALHQAMSFAIDRADRGRPSKRPEDIHELLDEALRDWKRITDRTTASLPGERKRHAAPPCP